MTDALLIITAVLAAGALLVGFLALLRLRGAGSGSAEEVARSLAVVVETLARIRDEIARLEQQAKNDAASQRQEIANQFAGQRSDLATQRTELADNVAKLKADVSGAFAQLGAAVADQIKLLTEGLRTSAEQQAKAAGELQKRLDEQLATNRGETNKSIEALTKSNAESLTALREQVGVQLTNQSRDAGERLETLRKTVEERLTAIQTGADAKLEQMRATVDEKLSSTLNTRLAESFKQVSERLEAVQNGLGEMKSLASNVTDLRRVMTNVKTRGVWGEVQLANLLEQMFTREQYERNFKPKPRGNEAVEFALRLPGPEGSSTPVYLPIDSKFPTEDYQRLIEAQEAADPEALKAAQKGLENRIWSCARDIRDKYLSVPTTTDFAVLFLPTEALYAEVLRLPGTIESLTRECKVLVQGPTTFSAFAMALLAGFRTLAIQKRSAEIGKLLGAIKTDFSKFADLLGKVEEKLDDAKSNIGKARSRSTQIVRKLGNVEELPQEQADELLPEPSESDRLLLDDQS